MINRIPVMISFMSLAAIPPAWAEPPADGTWVNVPALSDEFNAEALVMERWDASNRYYLGQKPGAYTPHNVVVQDGMLQLWAQVQDLPDLPPGYHTYSTAAITSRIPQQYGYFEIAALPMANPLLCAFWLYRWTETGTYEIDIAEIAAGAVERERWVHTNIHYYQGPPELETEENRVSAPQGWSAEEPLAARANRYALAWNAQELVWYFNDQPIRVMRDHPFHVPMYVKFSCQTYPNWVGLPDPAVLPDAFQVDYLRVWQRPSE